MNSQQRGQWQEGRGCFRWGGWGRLSEVAFVPENTWGWLPGQRAQQGLVSRRTSSVLGDEDLREGPLAGELRALFSWGDPRGESRPQEKGSHFRVCSQAPSCGWSAGLGEGT